MATSHKLVYAQNLSESSSVSSVDWITPIVILVAALIAGVFNVFLTPIIKEKYELRKVYFVPYRQWCSEFFGEMKEFKVRYLKNESTPNVSDIQIILDYWSIHHVVADAYRWMGTIRHDDEKVGDKLEKLIEDVELFWHSLENEYPKELPSVKTALEFNMALKRLCPDQRQIIANKIRDHLSNKELVCRKEPFEEILRYIKKNIPRKRKYLKRI